jgi:CRP-like cAMP-binding protein
LVDALGHTYQTIQRIVSQRLKNRIAAAILDFAQTPVAAKDDAGHWLIRTTHDGIAAAVGSVRETVTKVIGELTREGYIQSGYGKLVVLNLEGLKTLASETA